MGNCYLLICQKGDLEIKSILLVNSLLHTISNDDEIVVAIPSNLGSGYIPEGNTINFFIENKVNIFYFKNEYIITQKEIVKGDFLTNKLFCLSVQTEKENIIFLDSDIIALKPLSLPNGDIEFWAKQVNRSNEKRWNELYKLLKLDEPVFDIKCSVDDKYLPLYFNSGVFMIKKRLIEQFSSEAIHIYKTIKESKIMEDNSFFIEQVSVSLAVIKLKLKYLLVDNKFNYPARTFCIKNKDSIYFAHYHTPEAIIKSIVLEKFIIGAIRSNGHLKQLIAKNVLWNKYIGKYRSLYKIRLNLKKTLKFCFKIISPSYKLADKCLIINLLL
jgi:hypothetical protein